MTEAARNLKGIYSAVVLFQTPPPHKHIFFRPPKCSLAACEAGSPPNPQTWWQPQTQNRFVQNVTRYLESSHASDIFQLCHLIGPVQLLWKEQSSTAHLLKMLPCLKSWHNTGYVHPTNIQSCPLPTVHRSSDTRAYALWYKHDPPFTWKAKWASPFS